jgi:hypothetical protein
MVASRLAGGCFQRDHRVLASGACEVVGGHRVYVARLNHQQLWPELWPTTGVGNHCPEPPRTPSAAPWV